MQEQISFALLSRLFLRKGSDVVINIFGCKGRQYFDYVSQWASCFLIIRPTTPQFVEASLTVIWRMGQRVYHIRFYIQKWPIWSLWKNVTMQHLHCQKCKIKNCWRCIDAHLNDILSVIGCSTIICKNAFSHYWQPIYHFYMSRFAFKSFQASQFLIHH